MATVPTEEHLKALIDKMCEIINAERVKLNLNPIYCVPYLMDCAEQRTGEASEVWGHIRPDGTHFTSIIDWDTAQWKNIFENLTAGYDTAESAMESFRGSPNHWAATTYPDLTHMGVGLVYNPEGVGGATYYWSQIFLQDQRGADYEYSGQYLPGESELYPGTLKLSLIDTETGKIIPNMTVTVTQANEAKRDLSDVKITQNGRSLDWATDSFMFDSKKEKFLFDTVDCPQLPSGDYLITNCPSGNYLITISGTATNYYISQNHYSGGKITANFTMKNDGSEIPDITFEFIARKFSVLKKDSATGSPLAGAKLEISCSSNMSKCESSYPFEKIDNFKISYTTGDTAVVFSKIPASTYTITEVETPSSSYIKAEKAIFRVAYDGTLSLTTDNKSGAINTDTPNIIIIPNNLVNVTFSKLGENEDGTQSSLSGAVFQLKYLGDESFDNVKNTSEINVDTANKTVSWTSTDSSTVVSGLPPGKYELHETSAPDGFLANADISFSVSETGEIVDVVNAFGEATNNVIRIYNKRAFTKTVFQYDYITIYDSSTPQDKFETHGLGVLTPSECTITENANGKWELSITHPYDNDGKFQYFKQNNIIKALGQLFTIKTVSFSSGNRNEVTAKAEHIFYQQNDWWIFPNTERIIMIPNNSVLGLLNDIDAFATKNITPLQTFYKFSWDSDMTIPSDYPRREYSNTEGISPVNAIMDSGGILSVTGGELYRDNFYFSIRKRMENSNDNAFEIRIGYNLKGIKRTVDITTVCTYFQGTDNYGNLFAVSWTDDTVHLVGMPHSVIRSKKFTYTFEDGSVAEEEKASKAMQFLATDVLSFFDTNCKPLISYEIDLEDVQKNPDFIEFNNQPDYRVGNIGTVYDERIGEAIKLKITRTTKDAITGKTKSVVFGDNRNFTNQGYNSIIDIKPSVQEQSFHITDSSGAFVYDSEGNAVVEEVKNG